MGDDILLKIHSDIGEIKGLLQGINKRQDSHAERITKVEDNQAEYGKKQYGIYALIGALGGLAGHLWDKVTG